MPTKGKKMRIAIIDGMRTPMGKGGGQLKNLSALDLGVHSVKSIISRTNIDVSIIDELVFGNVAQPANAANIARVIALQAGLPNSLPAVTVHRNCASGMESITNCVDKIRLGRGDVYIAGGTESMSNIPLLFNRKMTKFFIDMSNKKASPIEKIKTVLKFRPNYLKPIIGLMQGLTDPVCGLNMGQTAEVLAKEFCISREEQDDYARLSHKRALNASETGIFNEEISPIYSDKHFKNLILVDEGTSQRGRIKIFTKNFVLILKSIQVPSLLVIHVPVSDGSAAVLLMSEEKAEELGYEPLGYLKEYAYAGLEPSRMGLGPVYATSKILDKTRMKLSTFDLIELTKLLLCKLLLMKKPFLPMILLKNI